MKTIKSLKASDLEEMKEFTFDMLSQLEDISALAEIKIRAKPQCGTKRRIFENHGFRKLYAKHTISGSKNNSEQGRRPTISLQACLFTQCRET